MRQGGDGGGGGPLGGGLPDCSDVWVGGETLPDDYEGCVNDDGTEEPAAIFTCQEDDGEFAVYQDRWWALHGGEIKDAGEGNAATNNAEYAEDFTTCQGS